MRSSISLMCRVNCCLSFWERMSREHETLWAGGKGLRASKLDLYTHGPVGGEKGCVEQEACWTLVIRLMHVGQVLCTVFSGGNFARAGFVSGGGGGG